VKAALDSLLGQIDDRFELVVADNYSDDGSAEILEGYQKQGRIKLIKKRGSRGVGREAALEGAIGQYIVSGLDMDDTFKPRLAQLVDFYHLKCDGSLLLTEIATHIAPRDLVVKLGGYHNLQFNENWDLFKRAARIDKFRWTIFPLLESVNEHPERRSRIGRIRYEYIQIRDRYRVGKRPFGGLDQRIRPYQRLVQGFVLLTLPLYESYDRDKLEHFTQIDKEHFIDSSDWWPDLKDSELLRRRYKSYLGMDLK
jgi:glycosyltransferase involved in cell wall biosynthesis